MKVKEYKTIHFLNEQHQGEELYKQILSMTSKYDKNITFERSKQLLKEFNDTLLEKNPSLIQTFFFDGKEFGIIPDFDKIKTKEFLDINAYENNIDKINRLLAVLYRPITSRIGKYYDIEEYEGSSKYAEIMDEVDINIYLSVVNFFLVLFQKLLEKDLNTSSVKKKDQNQTNREE